MPDRETIQHYANYAIIFGVFVATLTIIFAAYEYYISKQRYEWEYGDPQLMVYSYLGTTYVHIATNLNLSEQYEYGMPSYDFLICNLKGRPALLLDVSPDIQGPWIYHAYYNFSSKLLRQSECEEIRANFRPKKPIDDPEKLEGLYKLNLTIEYHDGLYPKTEYFLWNAFEIRNRSFSTKPWFER
jgi:hypothetical protein